MLMSQFDLPTNETGKKSNLDTSQTEIKRKSILSADFSQNLKASAMIEQIIYIFVLVWFLLRKWKYEWLIRKQR